MIRAIARIELMPAPGRGLAVRILVCPAAPAQEGGVFFASRALAESRIGQLLVVKFNPDDQFAYECEEALR